MIPLDSIRAQLGQDELRTFIAVASLHSFSAAGEALHKSTSAISYRIKMLEEGLNVRLFVRTTRSVTLTPAGEFLFEKASEIFDWLHTLPEQILACSKGVESHFTIVINSLLYEPEAAARLLAHLVQRYPHTQFNLKRGANMEVWDAMLTSSGHLGLGAPGFESLSDDYQSVPLGMIHWMFVVAPGHPLAHVPHALTDDEVRSFPTINVEDTSHYAVKRSTSKLPRQQEFIVPDLQTMIAAHVAGLGVGFMPSYVAQALVRDNLLVACNLVHARRPSPLSLVWRSEGGGEILNYLRDLCLGNYPLMQRFLVPIEPLSKTAVPQARGDTTGHRVGVPRYASPLNVDAISGDAELLNSPLSTLVGEARIHSVFERAINVEIGSGRLMTLASSEAENAPDTIVTSIGSWREADVEPGRAVRYRDGAVLLGEGVLISLARAIPWRCRLPAYPADPDRLSTNLVVARELLGKLGKGIGVKNEDKADAGHFPDGSVAQALRSKFAGASNGLHAALARGDLAAAQAHVEQLVGLGPGLTPAGDDFLLGLLTALNIPESPGYALRAIGSFALHCADRQTHLVSRAALRHAAEGRARESVVGLFEALMRGDPATLRSAMERVLGIGSSSGTEIALGLLSGFAIHLERGSSREREAKGATDLCIRRM